METLEIASTVVGTLAVLSVFLLVIDRSLSIAERLKRLLERD